MPAKLTIQEAYQLLHADDHKGAKGIIEIIVRDKRGNVVNHYFERNIVKIFAKEMLSHRIPSSEIWDQQANSGAGAWVASGIDPTEEFSARYILLGASFDENGVPLDTNDSRYYTTDPVTGQIVPIRLNPGAEFNGSLINAIPLAEPGRPLKRVEEIAFQATFQPSGTPILQEDVRGMNNIVKLSTTLRLEEYNGLGVSESDFFTITEIALAGGKKFDAINDCECTPRELFLEGLPTSSSGGGGAIPVIANGSDVVSIDPSVTNVDLVKEGDQIKLVGVNDAVNEESIDQVNPFYLIISKAVGGRDIQLDRTPVTRSNDPITGNVGIYRDTLRLFSHRLLSVPLKKSSDFEIVVSWFLIFN
jgi:hypothetical protein